MRNTFNKKESITEKKIIKKLFSDGKNINILPLHVKYLTVNKESYPSSRILIVVSKNNVKSSVKRNLIKRRIRESYRLNKNILRNLSFLIAFVYNSDKVFDYSKVQESVIKVLNKLKKLDD